MLLNELIHHILFDPRLLRNTTYNGRRQRFTAGKMRETSKFGLLREFGYTITERSKENGGVEIHIDPPEVESEIFNYTPPEVFRVGRIVKQKKPSQ